MIFAVASIGRLSTKNRGIQARLRPSWMVYRVAPSYSDKEVLAMLRRCDASIVDLCERKNLWIDGGCSCIPCSIRSVSHQRIQCRPYGPKNLGWGSVGWLLELEICSLCFLCFEAPLVRDGCLYYSLAYVVLGSLGLGLQRQVEGSKKRVERRQIPGGSMRGCSSSSLG